MVSDHKALETALTSNHENTTFSSRLTRWIDRLLPFDMEVVRQLGRTMGLADYLYGTLVTIRAISQKELWESWFVVNIIEEENCDMQLYTNQRVNKLFNRPVDLQQARHARERERAASARNALMVKANTPK